jgi:putative cell wall-binding protein
LTIRNTRVTKRLVAVAAATATIAALLAVPTSPVGATSTVSSVRIFGPDREASSVAIATAASTGVGLFQANDTHVVLANSRSHADSITASALAGTVNGTVILLPADGSLSAAATAQLATATNVFIVGGPAVVPATVEPAVQAVTTAATTFVRFGGATRFETMALVAGNIGTANVAPLANKKTVLLGNSDNFADLVSASPAAYAGDDVNNSKVHPVLLTPVNSLAAETKAAIGTLEATQVVILGGPAAVSVAVEEEVDAIPGVSVIRVQGATRYGTADAFAQVLLTPKASGGFGWSAANVGLANLAASGGGADALAASAYLGQAEAPMLGTNNGVLPTETSAFLDTNKAAVATLHIFGGTSAVPGEVLTAAETAAGKLAGPTAVITATEKSTVATVVFSEKVAATNLADYQLLGTNGVAFPNIASVTLSTDGLSAQIVFVDGSLMTAGVTIQLITASISTADGRMVDAISTVIAPDATAPSATLTAIIGTNGGDSDTFTVSFSEPVKGLLSDSSFTLAAADQDIDPPTYTLGGVVVGAPGPTTMYDAATVELHSPATMGSYQTLAIKAAVVTDPALNPNAAASTVVVADASKPTLTSATLAVTGTATAQLSATEYLFKAKAAGVTGNITIEVEVGTAADSVTVDPATSTITVTTVAGSPTHAAVAALIVADAAANALVSVDVLVTGNLLGDTTYVLAGGTSTATVTSTLSEDVSVDTFASITYDADAPLGGEAVVAASTAFATGNVVVSNHLLTTSDQLPVLNLANVGFITDAVSDNGGNGIAPVARNF